jgi:hypothetical protein
MEYTLQANSTSTMNTNSDVTLQNYNEFNNINYHQNTSYQYYNNNNSNNLNNNNNATNTTSYNNYYETTSNNKSYYPTNSNNINYNNDYYNSYMPKITTKSTTTNDNEQTYDNYKFSNSNNYYDWSTGASSQTTAAVNNDMPPVSCTTTATKSSPINQQTDLKYYTDINMLNNLNGQQNSCYGSYNMTQQYDDYNYDIPLVVPTAVTTPSNLVNNKSFINDMSCEIKNTVNDYSNWDYNLKTNSGQTYPPILGENNKINKQQAVLVNDNTNFNELTTYNYNYSVENAVKTPSSYNNYDHSISPLNDNINNNSTNLSYQYSYNNLQPSTSSNDQYKNDKTYSNSSHKKTLSLSKSEDNGFLTSTPSIFKKIF